MKSYHELITSDHRQMLLLILNNFEQIKLPFPLKSSGFLMISWGNRNYFAQIYLNLDAKFGENP